MSYKEEKYENINDDINSSIENESHQSRLFIFYE